MPNFAETSQTLRRSIASSRRMAATEPQTEVFTSSCERRNSGLTRPSVSAMHRCRSSAGGSETRSRVARSTSRYSSSSPSEKAGSTFPVVAMSGNTTRVLFGASVPAGENVFDRAGLRQVETLDVVDADLLEHLEHLGALHLLGDRRHLHGAADL